MPSTSKKQHNFMAAVAHNPAFAKKAGVPQSVGKDFSNADKGKTFKRGGDMAKGKKSEMPMKKMTKGGSIGSLTKISKAVAPVAKAVQKAAPAPIQKAAPAAIQKAAPVANAAINALSRMRSNAGGMAYAKGGGIESKGKTKGKMIKMNMGGKAC